MRIIEQPQTTTLKKPQKEENKEKNSMSSKQNVVGQKKENLTSVDVKYSVTEQKSNETTKTLKTPIQNQKGTTKNNEKKNISETQNNSQNCETKISNNIYESVDDDSMKYDPKTEFNGDFDLDNQDTNTNFSKGNEQYDSYLLDDIEQNTESDTEHSPWKQVMGK